MTTINKGDFVELEFTGKTAEEGLVFDTTDEQIAKDNNLYNEDKAYGPTVICIGSGQLIPGLDEQLEGKELEKNYKLEIGAEKAFGKKSAKMLKLVPLSVFRKQNISPVQGLQVVIDGMLGTVRTIGSRVIVDFNHPLAGKNVIYDVKANKIVTDKKEKLESLLKVELSLKNFKIELNEEKATIILQKKIQKEVSGAFAKRAEELIPELTEIEFTEEKV